MRGCLASVVFTMGLVLFGSTSPANDRDLAIDTAINGPSALATDNHGHLYVVEMNENRVLRVNLRDGRISTAAGNGKACCYKDGAEATQVSLDFLRALAVDSQGNIFIAESERIKRVDGNTGMISTVAGSEKNGDTIAGNVARSTQFREISGLAVDSDGNLFVADQRQGKIFKVDPTKGTVLDYAGTGKFGYGGDGGPATDATFSHANGLATDGRGNLVVADFENCAIRRVDKATGVIKTLGVAGGPGQNCGLRPDNSRPGALPSDPASDVAGNVYFVEGAVDFVMRIDAGTSAISALAGNGHRGFSGDTGPASKAELANPSGLAVDSEGNVFIAEYVNNRVRRVNAKTRVITTVAGNGLPHRIDLEM